MNQQNDRLQLVFREGGRRLTPQRRRVLEVLAENDVHLDAEAIHERVRRTDPNISLATVYRTLSVLKDLGLVEEHTFGHDHSHYETARPGPHYHFICLACGRVIEFDTPLVAQAIEHLIAQEGVTVTSVHLRVSGYCTACQPHPPTEATSDAHP